MYKKQGHNNERKERHLHNNLLKPIEAPPISFTFGKRKLVLAGWARWSGLGTALRPSPQGPGSRGPQVAAAPPAEKRQQTGGAPVTASGGTARENPDGATSHRAPARSRRPVSLSLVRW